ncbi:MAG: epoxyqueuosine reductase, partial [Nitrospiraceae bacterium]
MTLAEDIKREARALGFESVGISRFEGSGDGLAADETSYPSTPLPRLLYTRLQEWLQRGFHGTMSWIAREPHRRADPGAILAGCRSVVSVGMNYYTEHRADERPGRGRIARYAWGEDYHIVLKKRLGELEVRIRALAPTAETRAYVDTGPVME